MDGWSDAPPPPPYFHGNPWIFHFKDDVTVIFLFGVSLKLKRHSQSSIFPTAGQLSWTTIHPTSHHLKLYDEQDLNTNPFLFLSSIREKRMFFIANAYTQYSILAQKRFEDRDLII